MKVLFVYTNIKGYHDNCYAPGLAYIVSVTRQANHDVRVILIREQQDYEYFLSVISSFYPHVIGFSSLSSQFYFIKELSALVKATWPNILTVCGGVHPTIFPECILEAPHLDGIFVGESEYAFVAFLNAIQKGYDFRQCKNFAYNKEGTIVINELLPLITDLDTLPFPDKEVYPYREAIKASGFAPFFFTRGCPYLCTYCCNHAIAKVYRLRNLQPRYRSVENCILEIKDALNRFSMQKIVIRDDIFGLNREWCLKFCSEYARTIALPLSVFSRVDIIDSEYLGALKAAGCVNISLGVESGNEYVRRSTLNRKISEAKIIEAFKRVKDAGIATTAISLIGLPGETDAMILETLALNRRIAPIEARANVFYPYRGTKLGDYCFSNKYVNKIMYQTFILERRESVLNFPELHKQKLAFYQANWDALVNGKIGVEEFTYVKNFP